MSDDKKYYYLKLTDGFFDSDKMIVLESMTDGYIYSNILLKLYLRSLKNGGKLMFNDRIPFNSDMLSQVTRHHVGNIEKAMHIFKQLGLIEVLETGAIYLLDIQNFIGKSSTEADRKRDYRNKIELERQMSDKCLLKSGQISGQMSDKCPLDAGQMSDECPDKYPPEIEIEKEKEIEIETEKGQLAIIFKTYEEEIGMITPILSEDIEIYLKELSVELIIKAIREASTRNIKHWKYIKAILDRCLKENIKTMADYEAKSKKKEEVKREEFIYEDEEVDFNGLTKEFG